MKPANFYHTMHKVKQRLNASVKKQRFRNILGYYSLKSTAPHIQIKTRNVQLFLTFLYRFFLLGFVCRRSTTLTCEETKGNNKPSQKRPRGANRDRISTGEIILNKVYEKSGREALNSRLLMDQEMNQKQGRIQ